MEETEFREEEREMTVEMLQKVLVDITHFIFITDEGQYYANLITDLSFLNPEFPDDLYLQQEHIVGKTFNGVVYLTVSSTFDGYKIRGKNFFLKMYGKWLTNNTN